MYQLKQKVFMQFVSINTFNLQDREVHGFEYCNRQNIILLIL